MISEGQILDKYKVEKYIAPGGMGEVWLCNDERLSRNVAVKTIHSNYLRVNPDAVSILKDEACAGASLIGHPNIVTVLDIGESNEELNNTHYIVMEYMEGITVHKWLPHSAVLDGETYFNISLFIALEICKAIEFAHKNGILHRDIKPLNVFLSKHGLVKVGDFGLARFIDAVTRSYTVKNAMTYGYAAPEQWLGQKHSEQTDLYQLGCTLYELFTGQLPFAVPMPALINAHLNQKPSSPASINSVIPDDLSEAIIKTLEKKSEDRGALWEIKDVISKHIRDEFEMEVDVKSDADKIAIVTKITEFDEKHLLEGKNSWTFEDYTECLSEGIELILSDITSLTIRKVDK